MEYLIESNTTEFHSERKDIENLKRIGFIFDEIEVDGESYFYISNEPKFYFESKKQFEDFIENLKLYFEIEVSNDVITILN